MVRLQPSCCPLSTTCWRRERTLTPAPNARNRRPSLSLPPESWPFRYWEQFNHHRGNWISAAMYLTLRAMNCMELLKPTFVIKALDLSVLLLTDSFVLYLFQKCFFFYLGESQVVTILSTYLVWYKTSLYQYLRYIAH